MERHRCCSTVWVTIEAVRALAGSLNEPQSQQDQFDFRGRQDRNAGAHPYAIATVVVAM